MTTQREVYQRYISSQAWRNKRQQVLERDEYCCRMCGFSDADGLSLQVHHSSYENLGNEPLNKLITLCTHCHPLADQAQKLQRKRLGLTNQVRVNPSAFLSEVESSEIVVIEKAKNDIAKIDSQINRSIPSFNAQRTNSRSVKSLYKSTQGHIIEEREDRRRF